ncbi:hypothetical protein [Agrococcus baldri]|uniref:ABC-2 type transport system permease protein n=1 Tax=Agrococcus baldri TaxID=153730 RepID=A0AA87R973_9MICO|nr:hypothetical protein [Agrococcus baldri]GEK78919.1 hypothetical protein ABA31_02700 [Agrococcus baldri]
MAALLVGLRLRQLGRALLRSPWAIVTMVLGAVGALGLLSLLALAVTGMRAALPDAVPDALVLLGSALVVGWAVGAVLTSTDATLAPERFALLPVPARRLLPGVLLATALGVGGIATACALLLTLIGWSVAIAPLVAAMLVLPLQLLTCVLAGRAVAAVLARTLAGRRARDVVLVIGTVLLICAGLIAQGAIAALTALPDAGTAIGVLAEVLAWTPVGAAWGVPHAIASGSPLVALGQLAIALATAALLAWVWGRDFARRLTAPIVGGGGGRVRSGGWIDRMLPDSPVGAIAARGLRYRMRDPRHLVNVIGVVLLPLILVATNLLVGGDALQAGADDGGAGGMPALLPALAGLVLMSVAQLDTAYDGSALSAHVLAGVSGTTDRAGRALGIAVLYTPLLLLVCVGTIAVMGRWDLLPASLGATLGTAALVVGLGSAISVWMPGQTPAPEQSPFGRGSSGGAQALLGALLMVVAVWTVGLPVLGTAFAAMWLPWLGWVSLGLALGIGALSVWLGIRIGGRALERRWPEVLEQVSREP